MNVLASIGRLVSGADHIIGRLLVGAGCVSVCWAWSSPPAVAAEIAILKSSGISAYDQAITGFKSTAPSGAIYSEYDVQGDLEQGRKLAKKNSRI